MKYAQSLRSDTTTNKNHKQASVRLRDNFLYSSHQNEQSPKTTKAKDKKYQCSKLDSFSFTSIGMCNFLYIHKRFENVPENMILKTLMQFSQKEILKSCNGIIKFGQTTTGCYFFNSREHWWPPDFWRKPHTYDIVPLLLACFTFGVSTASLFNIIF